MCSQSPASRFSTTCQALADSFKHIHSAVLKHSYASWFRSGQWYGSFATVFHQSVGCCPELGFHVGPAVWSRSSLNHSFKLSFSKKDRRMLSNSSPITVMIVVKSLNLVTSLPVKVPCQAHCAVSLPVPSALALDVQPCVVHPGCELERCTRDRKKEHFAASFPIQCQAVGRQTGRTIFTWLALS
ncbi:hypothetical protein BCR44DRAFT_326176 [Catenaria anguillulae PL171]|uniref:Uncharacterized protein n=1 Tax=Catenaria anguillulae PL171 TaxID=765915 RepID=A0A1Y2H879_9FUNG|nr:hypothetical protein BCR44DRAFT_326176 [Catenaria anguillulae PL171]